MLENIERNIERSVEYAFKAKDDIVSAQKMKRRAQMVSFFAFFSILLAPFLNLVIGMDWKVVDFEE